MRYLYFKKFKFFYQQFSPSPIGTHALDLAASSAILCASASNLKSASKGISVFHSFSPPKSFSPDLTELLSAVEMANALVAAIKIAIFIAATSALAISTADSNSVKSGENDLGGLKEWNTDMPLDADFKLDAEAQRIADEAAKSSACVPIGEGENCW